MSSPTKITIVILPGLAASDDLVCSPEAAAASPLDSLAAAEVVVEAPDRRYAMMIPLVVGWSDDVQQLSRCYLFTGISVV